MAPEFSPTGLRVLHEVARAGSFSAAASTLGYTQSAVSRQVAALEAVAGRRLFERGRHGVILTPAGARLLPRAIRILDELDAARREAAGEHVATGPVRLGAFATAAAGLVPRALASMGPAPKVTLREGTTPALTRALRAGTLDLAILARTPPYRPLDTETPPLELPTLSERELLIGVSARHPFARTRAVEVDQLEGQVWVGGRSEPGEPLLGVWPGLPSAPTSATSSATGSPSSRSSPPAWPSPRSLRSPWTCSPTPSGPSRSVVNRRRRDASCWRACPGRSTPRPPGSSTR